MRFILQRILFIATFVSSTATATEVIDINPWRETYLQLKATRNHAVGKTESEYTSGDSTIAIGYRYTLNERWHMGVTGNFKSLTRLNDSTELALLTIGQETLFSLRIFHPHYLLIGSKLLYLLPSKSNKLPAERLSNFDAEIGLALTAQYHILINPALFLTLQIDRWRGTKTRKLNGFESSLGIGFTVP